MKRILILLLLFSSCHTQGTESPDVFNMSLEELMSLRVSCSGTLTKAAPSRIPASVTHISREMIRYSGARNLDELLEMYVPNYQRLRQAGGPHFGIRGIISDVDNKTLLLVNGRVMNHRSVSGAISERYLPLLGDIASIEVIRGPGSAMYGPGAINGVISIKTLTSEDIEGFEVSLDQGFIEKYSLMEIRYGHRFSDDAGIFVYFGIDDYSGASPDDSPLYYSKDSTFFNAGQKITDSNLVNDNRATFGKPHHKAHIHFQWSDFELWLHKTRGGVDFVNARHLIEPEGSFDKSNRSVWYDQFTVAAKQRLELSNRLMMSFTASYDTFDLVTDQERNSKPGLEFDNAAREDELNLKAMFDWDIADQHSIAIGLEFSYEQFCKDADWLTDDPGHLGSLTSDWSTRTYSAVGEYQWNPLDAWTFFLGGRADKYAYDDLIYSPRVSAAFSPNNKHQFKALLNRGVRKSEDFFLKLQADNEHDPDIEVIDMVELRHDWQVASNLTHSLSLFYYEHDVLGFVQQDLSIRDVGEISAYGCEFELAWRSRRNKVTFSHSYTKMDEFSYDGPGTQVLTSEPYGYGDDLANWANHLTKLNWYWLLNDKWKMNSSLIVYWGYPGAEDYTAFNNETQIAGHRNIAYGQSDGRTDAFGPSAFLNSGVYYQMRKNARLSLKLHNILGWFEEDLNKRNYYARMAGYRIEAPAFSTGLDISF